MVIANYGGSKEVDNDDGSLFYKIYENFMAYGWGQKFKCARPEAFKLILLLRLPPMSCTQASQKWTHRSQFHRRRCH